MLRLGATELDAAGLASIYRHCTAFHMPCNVQRPLHCAVQSVHRPQPHIEGISTTAHCSGLRVAAAIQRSLPIAWGEAKLGTSQGIKLMHILLQLQALWACHVLPRYQQTLCYLLCIVLQTSLSLQECLTQQFHAMMTCPMETRDTPRHSTGMWR